MSSSPDPATTGDKGGLSEIGRLTGVFWSPGAAFEDIAQRPRPWVPIILGIIVAVALVASFGHLVGWETFLEQELANNARVQELPLEQQQQIIETQAGVAGIMAYVASTAGGIVVLLIVAGILLLVMKIAGGADLTFKQSFGVSAYAFLPNLLGGLLAMIVLWVNPSDFQLKNPLPFNPGWFLDPASSPAWQITLLSSIDLFALWIMALLAVGFAAAAKKISFGKAYGLILGVWFLTVLLKTGWAAAFG